MPMVSGALLPNRAGAAVRAAIRMAGERPASVSQPAFGAPAALTGRAGIFGFARMLWPPVRAQHAARIGVAVNLALEIAQQQVVAVAADDGIRRQKNFSAAARRIHREQRRCISGRMAAQALDDFKALFDSGAEIVRTADGIALIEV